MNKTTEALKLAEEAAEFARNICLGMNWSTDLPDEALAAIRAARAQAKCADPVRTKGLGETMAEYLGERLHRDSFVRRAVSLPEPMEYPPVYPDESRQEQSTAYQYRKGWNDCLARCKQSNLSMQEQAEQDPVKMMNSVGNTEAYMPDQQTAGFNIQLYAAPVSIEAAVLAEREACAKVCEKIVPWGNSADDWAASCLNKAAKFIRARG